MQNKRYVVLISILLVVGVGICLFMCNASSLFGILFEEQIARCDIDNPYVDANYDGWKSIEWNGVEEIYIPQEWTLSVAEQGVFSISDLSGNVIAYITEFGNTYSPYKNSKDYLSFCIGQSIVDMEYHPMVPGISIANACLSMVELTTDSTGKKAVYVLELDNHVDIRIVFCNEVEMENYKKIFAICQAIAFSCYYK